MKRDMGLIRKILIFAEEKDEPWYAKDCDIQGWHQKDIVYNVGLVVEKGFLEGEDESLLGPDGRDFLIYSLTYDGHEYLDAIRSKNVWNGVRTMAEQLGRELSFDLVKDLASKIVANL